MRIRIHNPGIHKGPQYGSNLDSDQQFCFHFKTSCTWGLEFEPLVVLVLLAGAAGEATLLCPRPEKILSFNTAKKLKHNTTRRLLYKTEVKLIYFKGKITVLIRCTHNGFYESNSHLLLIEDRVVIAGVPGDGPAAVPFRDDPALILPGRGDGHHLPPLHSIHFLTAHKRTFMLQDCRLDALICLSNKELSTRTYYETCPYYSPNYQCSGSGRIQNFLYTRSKKNPKESVSIIVWKRLVHYY